MNKNKKEPVTLMEAESMESQNESFSGRMGYVLATAASAVGLGNIWRFPYLCAKYGGGIFLIIYLLLVVTFGYALMMSETAIGRKTGKSPIGAFKYFSKSRWAKVGGFINAAVPFLIAPYYAVIGGWVIKYMVEYIRGNTSVLASDSYFGGFISNSAQAELYFAVFAVITLVIILGGVQKGIERISKIMMPLLIVLAIVVSIYSITRPGAFAGVKYMFIPNIHNFSVMTIVSALGQMFFSLSIAMGILYTYGSHANKDIDLEKSAGEIELFDTLIAILAGLMIIPAVFAFSGGDPKVLSAGPSLMFVTLPKVFASMGLGTPTGIVFFLLVLLAALTSAVSITEACVGTIMDELSWNRKKSTLLFGIFTLVIGTASSLGYGVWSNVRIIGMQILDFFDFLTNSVMMPIAALATCILVFHVITIKAMDAEIELTSKFKRKKLYNFSIKWLCPLFLVVILVSSILNAFGIISM